MRSLTRPLFSTWLVIPACLLAVIFASAMLILFQDAFRKFIPGSIQVGGFTLDNFERMTRPIYRDVFLRTLLYSGACAAVNLILAYPLAYVMVRTRKTWLKSAILIITIMPLFTSDIVRTYAWLVMLGKFGFLNVALAWTGLISAPVEFLYTPTGVLIALVQHTMPIMVVILAAAISHVDSAVERAASILGATPIKVFVLVTLPMTLPGVVAGVLTIFAWNLSAFSTPQIIGGGRVHMIATLIYDIGLSNFNFPFASALSLVSLALIFMILGSVEVIARMRANPATKR